jgi:4-amino-4-deoxy-L-arabinose transferase-like glycosyltransferase
VPYNRDRLIGRLLRAHASAAAILALTVVGTGVIWNTRAAAGADAYGYVSQTDLWRRGNLFIDQRFSAEVPWPLARWTFAPLGYRPEPDGFRIVPTYSPGLPMLMAIATEMAGACAIFWIVPLAGGALTFATYWIGRRIGRPWVGLGAAWLVATSPVTLFMLMAPMSDIPAAAAWAIAVALALPSSLACEDSELRRGSPKRQRRGGGEDSPLAALASGIAVAIAILIRPNLVPLAAVVALWIVFREGLASRAQRARRLLCFVIPASMGAIAIALINARLYGSPLASGYGNLSDAYSWSYLVPNLKQYGEWLVMAETPLAVAGLACLFVPWRVLWPTRESRRARWLLASVAAGVWVSYLIYVPWDAWWYLRFLLPASPAMAIGTASLVAALYRVRSTAFRVAAVCLVMAFGSVSVRRAARLDVFKEQSGEAKYVEAARAVESITSPDDVIISGQFSGSVRYYAGRLTLRWDWLDPQWLDRAVEWLDARGHHVYILLEAPEVDPFRARFGATSAIGRVNWVPLVTFRGRSIQLHDAVRRERFERPIEQPPLLAVRECLPQKPFPSLR